MLGECAGEEPGDGDDGAVLVEDEGERRNHPWCQREGAPIRTQRGEDEEDLDDGHLWQETGRSEGEGGKQKQRETRREQQLLHSCQHLQEQQGGAGGGAQESLQEEGEWKAGRGE